MVKKFKPRKKVTKILWEMGHLPAIRVYSCGDIHLKAVYYKGQLLVLQSYFLATFGLKKRALELDDHNTYVKTRA